MKKVVPLFLLLFVAGCSQTVVPNNYALYNAIYQIPSLGDVCSVAIHGYVYSEGDAIHSEVIYLNDPFVSTLFKSEYTVNEGYYNKVGEDEVNEYYGTSNRFKPMGYISYINTNFRAKALVHNKKTGAFTIDIGLYDYTSPVYGVDFKKETLPMLSTAMNQKRISFQGYYGGVIRFVYEGDRAYGEDRFSIFELKYPEEDSIVIHGCKLIIVDASEAKLSYIVNKGFSE